MMGNGLGIGEMGWESKYGVMVQNMRDNGRIIRQMVLVNFIMWMAIIVIKLNIIKMRECG